MNTLEIFDLAKDQKNWQKLRSFSNSSDNYTYAQLKRLFHQRTSNKYPGLTHCFKLVGKTGYINQAIFGLWMADLLPIQQSVEA